MSQSRIFAVIGANGFIGSKLVRRLSASGVRVRALVRRPDAMEPSAKWEVVKFDLDDAAPSLQRALEGVDVAYYLVHSMAAGAGFAELDRNYALKFAYAAQAAGVSHVVYLGGLYPRGANDLSAHLQSRREVGEILLRECGALVIRASIVLGRGSASYEILRSLVLKLPVMVTPQWVLKKCQPIDADDAVEVLARAAEVPGGRVVDLAGRDVVTYRDMMLMMAEELGLKRVIIPVPVLSPGLSSHWLRFICDSPLPVARTLIESLRHDTVMEGTDLCAEVNLTPIGIRETLARAIRESGSAAT